MGKKQMEVSKVTQALSSLEMIADPYNEDPLIYELEKENGIIITEDEAPAYRANMKALWVEIPFSEKLVKNLKKDPLIAELYSDLSQVVEKNGKKVIRTPINQEISQMSDFITNDLCNSFEVCDKDLTQDQWEFLQGTPQWDRAMKKKTREYIASDFKAHYLEKLKKLQ